MGARERNVLNLLQQLQRQFTDTQLTDSAGLTLVTSTAHHFGLLRPLDGFEPCKVGFIGCIQRSRGTLTLISVMRLDSVLAVVNQIERGLLT